MHLFRQQQTCNFVRHRVEIIENVVHVMVSIYISYFHFEMLFLSVIGVKYTSL